MTDKEIDRMNMVTRSVTCGELTDEELIDQMGKDAAKMKEMFLKTGTISGGVEIRFPLETGFAEGMADLAEYMEGFEDCSLIDLLIALEANMEAYYG